MLKKIILPSIALSFTGLFAQAQTTAEAGYEKEVLPMVNTKYTEARPLISGDGTKLFFVRRNYPTNQAGVKDQQDVYVSYYNTETSSWSEPENLGSGLNNKKANAVASVNADGTELILFNTYKSVKGTPLVRSQKTESGWSAPTPVPISGFVNISDYADYHYDFRNNVLISAVEGDVTQGEQDLYISFPDGYGGWKAPQNLGEIINSKKSEFSPFLAADGRSLYFSSTGHKGLGGSDIFLSVRLDDTWLNWSEPVNLGPTVNSSQEESYFSITDDFNYLYYTSYNINQGDRNIARVKLPEDFNAINGPVLARLDSAAIKSVMLSGDYKVSQSGAVKNFQGVSFEGWPTEETSADATEASAKVEETAAAAVLTEAAVGEPEKALMVVTKDPEIAIASEEGRYAGFVPAREAADLPAEAEQFKQYLQQKLPGVNLLVHQQNGQVAFKIEENLLYDFNEIYADTDYLPRLRRLNSILREKEDASLMIIGHTDQYGGEEINERVSRLRAESLKQYFTQRGVANKRIEVIAAGMNELLSNEDSEAARRQNRRVETIILLPL